MDRQKLWLEGGASDKEYLEIAYKAMQKARDVITCLYYREDGFVRPDIKLEYRAIIGDIDYILRCGFGTREHVEKYELKVKTNGN